MEESGRGGSGGLTDFLLEPFQHLLSLVRLEHVHGDNNVSRFRRAQYRLFRVALRDLVEEQSLDTDDGGAAPPGFVRETDQAALSKFQRQGESQLIMAPSR